VQNVFLCNFVVMNLTKTRQCMLIDIKKHYFVNMVYEQLNVQSEVILWLWALNWVLNTSSLV
jgi:hypothetical protein